jgi:hypothetical protein
VSRGEGKGVDGREQVIRGKGKERKECKERGRRRRGRRRRR